MTEARRAVKKLFLAMKEKYPEYGLGVRNLRIGSRSKD